MAKNTKVSHKRKVKCKHAQIYLESLKILPWRKPKIVVCEIIMAVEIRRLVLEFFAGNEEKTELWFTSQNPLLGGITPAKMIAMGRAERLLHFIKEQLAENEESNAK